MWKREGRSKTLKHEVQGRRAVWHRYPRELGVESEAGGAKRHQKNLETRVKRRVVERHQHRAFLFSAQAQRIGSSPQIHFIWLLYSAQLSKLIEQNDWWCKRRRKYSNNFKASRAFFKWKAVTKGWHRTERTLPADGGLFNRWWTRTCRSFVL